MFLKFSTKLLLLLYFLSIVSAQTDNYLLDRIDETREQTERARDFVNEKRWEFIGQEWKNYLLEDTFIKEINSFFERINIVFVILFARDYSLSLTLFFAFLIWIFTFLWISQLFVWFKEEWQKLLAGFLATVGIAHLQFYNKSSEIMFKLIFYRGEILWSFMIFISSIIVILVYFYLGRFFARVMKNNQEKKEKKETSHKLKVLETKEKAEEKASS